MEKVVRSQGQDLQDVSDDLDELEEIVENLDNNHRKNSIKIRGLKEGVEGSNLVVFLAS